MILLASQCHIKPLYIDPHVLQVADYLRKSLLDLRPGLHLADLQQANDLIALLFDIHLNSAEFGWIQSDRDLLLALAYRSAEGLLYLSGDSIGLTCGRITCGRFGHLRDG